MPATRPRAGFSVVVLAASTGGVRALRTVVSGLPAEFPVPVLVVQHRGPGTPELLSGLLSARPALPVSTAAPGPMRPGVAVLPAGTTGDLSEDGRLSLRPCATVRTA